MFTVIVSDKYKNEDDFYNSLIFDFSSKEEAIKFAEQIINISEYLVEIIPHKEGE